MIRVRAVFSWTVSSPTLWDRRPRNVSRPIQIADRRVRISDILPHMEDISPPLSIPSLKHLPAQSEILAVRRGIARGGSHDHSAYVLQANSVRLADAAVRDYLLGEHSIAQHHARQSNQFGLAPLILSTTHFESCIWHLERFIKHVKALRACPSAEQGLRTLIPRDSVFLQGRVEGKLTRLRHTLAHLEKDAGAGRIPRGQSIALLPMQDGLRIGSHHIGWEQLAAWLAEAHACAAQLARFMVPKAGA